jgi:hypothetical protein
MKISTSPNQSRKFCPIIILGILFASFQSGELKAAILTVDNNYPKIGQFAKLQEAYDAASIGDTIYVYPSQRGYSGITVTKKIILIGSGFETSQTNVQVSFLGNMTFNPGSQNSIIEGFDGYFEVIINDNDITLKRNRIGHIILKSGHEGNIIYQNFIQNTGGVAELVCLETDNEVIIRNNILFHYYTGVCIHSLSSNISIILDHNIFCQNENHDVLWLAGSSLRMTNCIILNGTFREVNTSEIFNNMSNWDQLSSNNGNIPNVNLDNVFVDWKNNDFHLKPGSPAIGSDVNGVDMGVYGGDTPFIDGGYPDIPAIYYLDVPLTGSQKDGINVTIKVKSNN